MTPQPGCVFCDVLAGRRDEGVIAYRDDATAVIPSRDQWATNPGHMLVVTVAHYRDLDDVPPSIDTDLLRCLRRTAAAVRRVFDASGTTIHQNNGPPGQDVFHVHFHVIPRHPGDRPFRSPFLPLDLDERIRQARLVADAL